MCGNRGSSVLHKTPTPKMVTRSSKAAANSPRECIICLDSSVTNIHSLEKCGHLVCESCLCNYLQSLVQGSLQTQYETLPCPQTDCKNKIDTNRLLDIILTKEEIEEWWEKAYMILFMKNKITCPFDACGVSFVIEEELLKECQFASCLLCHRGFCTACQTLWHPGKMKVINETKEDKKTLETARKKAWTRCPSCKCFVEKISGCTSMACTCGTLFCYRCGGIQTNHTCSNHCERFTNQKLQETRESMFTVPA